MCSGKLHTPTRPMLSTWVSESVLHESIPNFPDLEWTGSVALDTFFDLARPHVGNFLANERTLLVPSLDLVRLFDETCRGRAQLTLPQTRLSISCSALILRNSISSKKLENGS